jgi:hypothetical protein
LICLRSVLRSFRSTPITKATEIQRASISLQSFASAHRVAGRMGLLSIFSAVQHQRTRSHGSGAVRLALQEVILVMASWRIRRAFEGRDRILMQRRFRQWPSSFDVGWQVATVRYLKRTPLQSSDSRTLGAWRCTCHCRRPVKVLNASVAPLFVGNLPLPGWRPPLASRTGRAEGKSTGERKTSRRNTTPEPAELLRRSRAG